MAHPDFMPGLGTADPPHHSNPEHSNPEYASLQKTKGHRRHKNPRRKGRKPRLA